MAPVFIAYNESFSCTIGLFGLLVRQTNRVVFGIYLSKNRSDQTLQQRSHISAQTHSSAQPAHMNHSKEIGRPSLSTLKSMARHLLTSVLGQQALQRGRRIKVTLLNIPRVSVRGQKNQGDSTETTPKPVVSSSTVS